ncbi:MAG: hypothetical protein J0H68_03325 [Sphingobacteriia bacterium]|nr:hypothetical protein [Sphingobacteriia bacterium]
MSTDIITSQQRLAKALEMLETYTNKAIINAQKKGQDFAFEQLKSEIVSKNNEINALKAENELLTKQLADLTANKKEIVNDITNSIKQLDLIIEAKKNGNS